MKVGDRIKYYREAKRMTQPELGDRAGVGFSAVSKYERGTVTNIPIERLQKIADALDVTTGVLLGIEPDLINTVKTPAQKEIEDLLPYLSEEQQEIILSVIKEFR
ncbi:MAG: helix-turn-helix domain-containing protein [Oscillospiraceae bacterium]|nr:helix-turn-helix domain-containing protein [Oscillospiraceae bacterium]